MKPSVPLPVQRAIRSAATKARLNGGKYPGLTVRWSITAARRAKQQRVIDLLVMDMEAAVQARRPLV